MFERDGWKCRYCGSAVRPAIAVDGGFLPDDAATIDHLVALANGGKDEPSNWLTSCWKCNRDKSNRHFPREVRDGFDQMTRYNTAQNRSVRGS